MITVFTNGCFDILHRGHVECLRHSKDLGDKLIVGLNSDDSVRRLKGSKRPINKQDDRIAVLQAIRWVDEVVVFEEDTPYQLIQRLRPDVITKGGDYTPETVVGNDLARVVILPYLIGRSTTRILDAS